MKKRGWITFIVLLIIWMIAGHVIDNPMKLPKLLEVLSYMIHLLTTTQFYEAFAYTLARCVSGLLVALCVALILGVMSGLNKKMEEYFEPIYIILKSIPNISYIMIVLIWSNSTFTMRVISFMVMFPVAYANILKGMKSIEKEYLDVMEVYPQSLFYKIVYVYLPLISNYIWASISSGLGLTFKVGIMAEILGAVSPGVGREFQLCRLNVDMIGTFAWTFWLVLFLFIFDFFIQQINEL